MDKSPDAFRTISEVAEELDLPQHVLRFWETRFSQIKPMKRGGGRRYYRPHDVELIKGIRHMLYDQGYTIKGVQKLLREGGLAKAVRARGRKAEPASETAAAATRKPAADQRQIGMPFELLSDMGNLKQALKSCLRELEGIHADIVSRQKR